MNRIAGLIVSVAACVALVSPAPVAAQDLGTPGDVAQEKLRMANMSEQELADLIRAGTRAQVEAAVQTLAARRQGDLLLGLAKEGPRPISDIILENYVPKATVQDAIKAKELVDHYLVYMEGQIKSETPLVTPERAVRSLGRTVYWAPTEYVLLPGKPRPEARYQHDRVVGNLIALLHDPRPMVSDAAANWLGNVAGYSAEQAKQATGALADYRASVAAERPSTNPQAQRQKMRLGMIDVAIASIKKEAQARADMAAKTAGSPTPPR